jgi:hypothetical protein
LKAAPEEGVWQPFLIGLITVYGRLQFWQKSKTAMRSEAALHNLELPIAALGCQKQPFSKLHFNGHELLIRLQTLGLLDYVFFITN